jgi:hypothetical protein
MMHSLRKFLCWLFALSSFTCAQLVLFYAGRAILHPHNRPELRSALVLLAAFAPLILLFGTAWWTVWKGRPTARRWALAASFVNVAIAFIPLLLWRYFHIFEFPFFVHLGIGVAGLIAFWRPYEIAAIGSDAPPISAGDGTYAFLNKASSFLVIVAIVLTVQWWSKWCYDKEVVTGHVPFLAIFLAVELLIITIHEFGHMSVGLLLGMRMWALQIGPFQWRKSGGRWTFKFELARLLAEGGAAGVVPTTVRFQRWKHVLVSMGGVVFNFASGTAALWVAYAIAADSPWQLEGALALFGATSLSVGIINLIPFLAPCGYSDGAQLRQLLAGGPWAELHEIMAVVKSSLVTPTRPRDYDIAQIERAATGITNGVAGMLLRLFKYSYYLDRGDRDAAAQGLREAEAMVLSSPGNLARQLESEFVFGAAYALRDAATARQWWEKLETSKNEANSDYWKAACALHWIEGDSEAADTAWLKGNQLAQQLPQAGAYDHDRDCFRALRRELDLQTAKSTSA